jgi:hypothetical protein
MKAGGFFTMAARADVGVSPERTPIRIGGAPSPLEILGNIDSERLQRRDVDNTSDTIGRLAAFMGLVEPIDRHQERRQGFARARRSGDKRVFTRGDMGPGSALRRCRTVRESLTKPRPNRWMEGFHPRVIEQAGTVDNQRFVLIGSGDMSFDYGHARTLRIGCDTLF